MTEVPPEEPLGIVSEEHLREGPAKEFIQTAWERGYVPEGGLELNGIMPPINPFAPMPTVRARCGTCSSASGTSSRSTSI